MKTQISTQVNTTFDYSEEYREWLRQEYPNSGQDSQRKHQSFLVKHTDVWDEALASTIESEVQDYLHTQEIEAEVSVKMTKSTYKEGSLTIIATVLIGITKIAKNISETVKNISEAVKNFNESKMIETFTEKISETGSGILYDELYPGACPENIPKNIFYVENLNVQIN